MDNHIAGIRVDLEGLAEACDWFHGVLWNRPGRYMSRDEYNELEWDAGLGAIPSAVLDDLRMRGLILITPNGIQARED